jgi:hypothetical protein
MTLILLALASNSPKIPGCAWNFFRRNVGPLGCRNCFLLSSRSDEYPTCATPRRRRHPGRRVRCIYCRCDAGGGFAMGIRNRLFRSRHSIPERSLRSTSAPQVSGGWQETIARVGVFDSFKPILRPLRQREPNRSCNGWKRHAFILVHALKHGRASSILRERDEYCEELMSPRKICSFSRPFQLLHCPTTLDVSNDPIDNWVRTTIVHRSRAKRWS